MVLETTNRLDYALAAIVNSMMKNGRRDLGRSRAKLLTSFDWVMSSVLMLN